MRRKNLLKELGIQKQADTSCNALDIDTENIRQRVYAKLDFADTERKQTTMRSKKKILPLLIAATLTIGATAVAATGKISMWTGSSASRADYTSLPTAEQVTKNIGYRPVLIDTFENGYCFKDGNIVKNSFKDDNEVREPHDDLEPTGQSEWQLIQNLRNTSGHNCKKHRMQDWH